MPIVRIKRALARGFRTCSILLLAISINSLMGFAMQPQEPRGRLMPPLSLKCDRNDLTVYDGKVLDYRRSKGRTYLRIRTNFDTTEAVTIRHPGTDDPSPFFLLNAEPFTKSDWRRIEKKKGVLKLGMRANIWVCRGNPAIQPVLDWRPDDSGAYPKSR